MQLPTKQPHEDVALLDEHISFMTRRLTIQVCSTVRFKALVERWGPFCAYMFLTDDTKTATSKDFSSQALFLLVGLSYSTKSGGGVRTVIEHPIAKMNTVLATNVYAPMKLTTSGRGKLTTCFAGEEKVFMHV